MGKVVGYFEYSDDEKAMEALKEQDKIMKLEGQVDYENPKLVYMLYNKMIDSKVFHTPEGILYLVHLQDYLNEQQDLYKDNISPIKVDEFLQGVKEVPIKTPEKTETINEPVNGTEKPDADGDDPFEEERMKYLDKIRILELEKSKAYRTLKVKQRKTDNIIYKMIIAFLVMLLVIMFGINIASGGPTILNYRQQIQNEYSEWQKQLEEKEKELNEREKELRDAD